MRCKYFSAPENGISGVVVASHRKEKAVSAFHTWEQGRDLVQEYGFSGDDYEMAMGRLERGSYIDSSYPILRLGDQAASWFGDVFQEMGMNYYYEAGEGPKLSGLTFTDVAGAPCALLGAHYGGSSELFVLYSNGHLDMARASLPEVIDQPLSELLMAAKILGMSLPDWSPIEMERYQGPGADVLCATMDEYRHKLAREAFQLGTDATESPAKGIRRRSRRIPRR